MLQLCANGAFMRAHRAGQDRQLAGLMHTNMQNSHAVAAMHYPRGILAVSVTGLPHHAMYVVYGTSKRGRHRFRRGKAGQLVNCEALRGHCFSCSVLQSVSEQPVHMLCSRMPLFTTVDVTHSSQHKFHGTDHFPFSSWC